MMPFIFGFILGMVITIAALISAVKRRGIDGGNEEGYS